MAKTKQIKDEMILEALFTETTVEAAAIACGCSRSTIYNRLKDPVFSRKITTTIEERQRSTSAIAAKACEIATEKLIELLTAPGVSDAIRLRAATAVLKAFWGKNGQVSTQTYNGGLDWL